MNRNKLYMPGEVICPLGDQVSGRGTYVSNNAIIASIVGKLTLNDKVISLVNQLDEEQPELKIGSIVFCKVMRIKDDRALVKLLKVDGKKCHSSMEGIIRKQNIRTSEVDKLKMDECFLPGDIVKAKVISYGDSHTIFLSTVDEDLGVVFAKSQESGELMIPLSWSEMICLKSGIKEKRIVAKPDFSKFQVKQ